MILLSPFMDEAKIELKLSKPPDEVPIYAPLAAIESIAANLIINAINAVVNGPQIRELIPITIAQNEGEMFASLTVADNGAGIEQIAPEEIWLPGRTTRDQGTGWAHNRQRHSHGSWRIDLGPRQHGPMGGAVFAILLPVIAPDDTPR